MFVIMQGKEIKSKRFSKYQDALNKAYDMCQLQTPLTHLSKKQIQALHFLVVEVA